MCFQEPLSLVLLYSVTYSNNVYRELNVTCFTDHTKAELFQCQRYTTFSLGQSYSEAIIKSSEQNDEKHKITTKPYNHILCDIKKAKLSRNN